MFGNWPAVLFNNFLGHSPVWYKWTILGFLVLNPGLMAVVGPVFAGWCLILEFIFVLAMALKCYPLQPGGLLTLEMLVLGLATPEGMFHEVLKNIEVILLVVFMVAGIYFMKDLLTYVFTKLFIRVKSKSAVSLLILLMGAFLSAFLDALTVVAVLITVSTGFFTIYHRVASRKKFQDAHDHTQDGEIHDHNRTDLEQFRSFLRSLMMHGAVGTALGGVCTMVGEPQNLLIAKVAGWQFGQFFFNVAPVSMPVLGCGILTALFVEWVGWFGYGGKIPDNVRTILDEADREEDARRSDGQKAALVIQGIVAALLIVALAFHLAAVGLIGLFIIVVQTAFNGIIEEHQIGRAFSEGLPFTALLIIFFGIVAMIVQQGLFAPVIHYALTLPPEAQPGAFFIANGLLSSISDNVFVATIYITEVKNALDAGVITREHFDRLAVAINTGTNLPSVATPNGQAAFLFLLTSPLAGLIRLSYGRMVVMALPYTLVLSLIGYLAVRLWI